MATTVETDSAPADEAAVETITLGRTTAPRYMTLEEFEEFSWGFEKAELVRGEVRLSPMAGVGHGWIVRNIFRALDRHVVAERVGEVFGDGIGYRLPGLPKTVRAPDVAFVRSAQLPSPVPMRGAPAIAPDLAVEVLSPRETWSETEEKIADLFAAGTAVVWVVDPRHKRVTIRTPDGAPRVVGEDGTLDGAPVLPEFTMRVADVFAGVQAPAPRRRRKSS